MTSSLATRSTAPSRVAVVALATLVAATWAPTCAWMASRWAEPGGYFVHGFLVPPAAAWLAFRRRKEATFGARPATASGLALVAAASLVQIASALFDVHFASACALVVAIAGLVLAVGGRAALRAYAPAIALLSFMVPVPLEFVAAANLHLKIAASSLAVMAAQTLGVVVVQDGAAIALPGGDALFVGAMCSGLRFLVGLAAVGAFVALVARLSPARRAALFAASLPIAFLANVLRVLVLLLAAARYGSAAASEGSVLHDVSGVGLFVVALAALLGLEAALRRCELCLAAGCGAMARQPQESVRWTLSPRPPPALALLCTQVGVAPAPRGAPLGASRGRGASIGAFLVLLPAAVVTWTARPGEAAPRAAALSALIPRTLGAWSGDDVPLDSATLAYLRSDDCLNRPYAAPGEPTVTLTVVFSGRVRKAVHPPEVCLMAQGWELFERGEIDVAASGAHVTAVNLRFARGAGRLDVLSWYVADREPTPSFLRQQWSVAWASLRGRAPGAALVRILCETTAADPRDRGAEAARRFAAAALPSIANALR